MQALIYKILLRAFYSHLCSCSELDKAIDKLRLSNPKHMPFYDPKYKEPEPKAAGSGAGGINCPPGSGGSAGGSGRGSCSGSNTRVQDKDKGEKPAVEFAGVGNRLAYVRIPFLVTEDGRGHIQDRRPLSNSDPYRVAEYMVRAICACSANSRPASPHGSSTHPAAV